ncbi:hypothetical protein Rhopal_005260-T1 [Rhodotorula paludigena]|uniref:Mitochondrial distribution and morphology protein 10 n=1 Tax=Rhodotorula paludigena TaxID=86838 RepID=A0AAV5GQR4_9BASI|nr:hypothetical protein Rhopal_005260-T1 [Rhodotorula paludigena]
MSQQAAYLLREFLLATQWNTWDNHYGSFTHPSRQLLDFAIPPGLHFTAGSHPTPSFSPGLTLSSLVPESGAHVPYPPSTAPVLGPPATPLLAGQLSYLFSSAPIAATSSKRAAEGLERIRFKDVVQSFPLGSVPVAPELREDALPTWKGGLRIDTADYLLYGRLYAPSPRLDALYVQRLTPTLQGLVSLVTVPSPAPPPTLTWESTDPTTGLSASSTATAAAPVATSGPLSRLSELELKLQQDTGRWSAEYSYAVGDGMWGVKGLWNFGRRAGFGDPNPAATATEQRERVVDEEEDEMPNGLKGRWSAGGEIYFSAQERSAGVSTGVRFVTIPESAGGPQQVPTYITATLNPIMGQLSTAYAVQVGRDASLASRFDFNMYSYDADLTVGGEWFHRRNPAKDKARLTEADEEGRPSAATSFDAFGRGADDEDMKRRRRNNDAEDEVLSVLKVRASTNTDVALLWEGRLGDFLVSAGLVADLRRATQSRGRISPIRSVGLSVSYWA